MKFNVNFKEKRGITIVALVVTVIALTILLGISVATLTAENGVMINALDAKTTSEIAKLRDTAVMVYTTKSGKKAPTMDDIAEGLKEEGYTIQKENNKYYAKINGLYFQITLEEGKIIVLEEGVTDIVDNDP